MKPSLFIGIIVAVMSCLSTTAGNYILTIDGKQHDIDLDQQNSVKLSDGKTINVLLKKKTVAAYKEKWFSFDYPSDLKPSRTKIMNGLYQTMLATPTGALILIQEYSTINPVNNVDRLLNSVTRTKVRSGYKAKTEPVEKTIQGGIVMKGKSSYLTDKEKWTKYEVYSYGKDKSGIIIMTMSQKINNPQDIKMLNLFWKTIKISM